MSEVKETVWIEDCTLANLIWRKFNRQPEGFIEKVIERNPGIEATHFIPVGTEIVFPISEIEERKVAQPVVRLWD